jgi:hypothetical protein
MNVKRLRKKQKIRAKPSNREKLNLLEYDKRLKAKRASKAKEAVYMRILGGVMLVGTVYIWYWRGYIIPMSSLTIIGGIIVAVIFKVVYPDGIDAKKKVRNFLGYLVIGSMLLLMVNQTAFVLATMFLFSFISAIYLFGVMKSFPDSRPQSQFD